MIKRGNIRSTKVYIRENGNLVTKYAVQVRIRNSQKWVQARKDDFQLIFDTPEEADKIVIDYVAETKKTMLEKINDGGVRIKMDKKGKK